MALPTAEQSETITTSTSLSDLPVQLAFDFDAPVIDIRARIKAEHIKRGMTKKQLAGVLGMKQPLLKRRGPQQP